MDWLGPLLRPLQEAATANDRSLKAEIRARLAETLGKEPPSIAPGNPVMQTTAGARKLQRKSIKARKIHPPK